MPSVRVTPVVGLPQFDGWSQVVESSSSSFGSLVVSLAIEGNHAGNVGRDLTTVITQASIFSFEEFYSLLQEIITLSSENDTRVLFGAGCFTKHQCAYATYNGAVLLKRETKIGRVLSSGNQLKMITGTFGDQDVVVLSSLSSAHFFNEIEQKFSLGFDVDTIVTSVVPGVHAESNSSLSSLAFVTYKESTDDRSSFLQDFSKQEDTPSRESTMEYSDDEELDDSSNDERISQELAASLDQPIVHSKAQLNKMGQLMSQFVSIWKQLFDLLKKGLVWLFVALSKGIHSLVKLLGDAGLQARGVAFISKLISRDTYVETSTEKKKKVLLVIGGVVLLAAGVITFQLLSGRARARAAAELEAKLAPITQTVTAAQEQLEADPVTARDELQKALAQYEQTATEYKSGSYEATTIAAIIVKTRELYDGVSGLEELAQLNTFYDLRLVNSSFISKYAVLGNGKLYFFDSEAKALIVLELDTKKVTEIELQDVSSAKDTALLGSTLLFLGEGISSWDEGSQVEKVLEVGDSNRGALLMGTYETYVYVVNPEKRNVYRYAVNDGAFSEPVGWMQVTKGLEYDKVHSVAIDGDMWIGTKDGTIRKFTRGEEQEFIIRGLEEGFTSSLLLTTTTEGERLYVLEPDSNRVVVLSKQGDFLREVTNVALGSATELLVDEGRNILYVVSGSIIFEIPLGI